MSRRGSNDLTTGSIYKSIILFALPILASHILQNLYHSVDSIVVGNNVGTTALAAVSSCTDISALLTGFFTGLSIGAGVLFARYYGAKDQKNLHDSIHTALTFSVILGTCMAVIGVLVTPLLLRIVGCPEDVWPEALDYLRIYFIGVLFTAIYNVGAGVLRAVGDSIDPFIFLLISSSLNIVLDLITVIWFGMGVIGVAVATIISQFVSVALVFGKMLRTDDIYRIDLKDMHIDPSLLKEVIRLGIPSAIQSSLLSLSNLFVQRYLNSFGSAAMAGSGAAKKVDKFIGMVGQSIGQATAPYVSQNIGARNYRRVRDGIRATFVISLVTLAVMMGLVYGFSDTLIGFFTKDPDALYYGMWMLHVLVPFYICQNLNQILSNVVRGYGRSSAVMLLSLSGMVGMRQLFLNIAMRQNYVISNVFLAYPVGWASAGLFVCIYYLVNRKKLIEKAFGNVNERSPK